MQNNHTHLYENEYDETINLTNEEKFIEQLANVRLVSRVVYARESKKQRPCTPTYIHTHTYRHKTINTPCKKNCKTETKNANCLTDTERNHPQMIDRKEETTTPLMKKKKNVAREFSILIDKTKTNVSEK